jgi:prepilin-type N-terminal cleavage/methylation domain-containing protein
MRPVNNIKKSSGFSLVELAVVVVIMGMILTMGIKMASSFQDRSAMSLTHSKQLAIKEALISYLAANGRLPCPADPTISLITGYEKSNATFTCDISVGIVPYKTLQLPKEYVVDGWDRFFTYEPWWGDTPSAGCTAANPNQANLTKDFHFLDVSTNPRTYHDGDDGCVTINETKIDGTTLVATRYLAAILISHGQNGFGGYSSKGVQVDTAALTNSEKNNIVGHTTPHIFHTEPLNDNFDDIVLEISANDLVAPLKRDGTIVSINQLARDQLLASKPNLVDASCNIILPSTSYVTTPLHGQYPSFLVTFSSITPKFSVSTNISQTDFPSCPLITAP